MIPVTEPIQAIQGRCSTCRERVFQVLIESNLNGSPARHWLKVDEVRSAGDEGDGICGYSEHCCKLEAA